MQDSRRAEALRAANERASELRAALAAAEAREHEREAADAAAAEQANRVATNKALQDLNRAGKAWDKALDALAAATQQFEEAARQMHQLRPGAQVYRKIEDARVAAETIIEHRLQPLLRRRAPFFTDEQAQIVEHLPQPEDLMPAE